jgi:hypothetical protein
VKDGVWCAISARIVVPVFLMKQLIAKDMCRGTAFANISCDL